MLTLLDGRTNTILSTGSQPWLCLGWHHQSCGTSWWIMSENSKNTEKLAFFHLCYHTLKEKIWNSWNKWSCMENIPFIACNIIQSVTGLTTWFLGESWGENSAFCCFYKKTNGMWRRLLAKVQRSAGYLDGALTGRKLSMRAASSHETYKEEKSFDHKIFL